MPKLSSAPLPVYLVAGCATAIAAPLAPPAPSMDLTDVVSLRAEGPEGLHKVLARWDQTAPGARRDALALAADKVAAQRYATVSRMYWYTDLDTAQTAARAQHKPILALRMLGRLDEDLSCANSRLFRATLYANRDVSAFLRSNFILYWSSERPVPRVTIDFGDGRKLERTTTGNSAHYVLAADGTVLDVLPGLYAPAAFKAELTASLALARKVERLSADQRRAVVVAHHRGALAASEDAWKAIAGTQYLPDAGRLSSEHELATAVARAQRATMSKAMIEVPDLRIIADGVDPGQLSSDDAAVWAAIGQRHWNLRGAGTGAPIVLDAGSRALITRLHNAAPGLIASADDLARMLARLEQHVVADSAIDEFQLRPKIRRRIIDSYRTVTPDSFASLNEWIYAEVFFTPRTDEWLGLLPRTDFTGLPGDGVVRSAR
ncbi:MAG: hypothetical protein AB7P03_01270 [Kofleriaceae bacterium]